tara:strand:- start:942 stop:4070 length:3129 start_codon:yes stop_codon:yes gene_type:complete
MATYVQGYKMYDREPTPFVPDYKFLSNVLETRQNRYDQNYKAINDAYSKVVFADLSRAENQETRDQFASQIAPKMAQISGYDLSLRQNADMAKGVFTPFYEDDNIVRDLTNTANYKFGIRYADQLSRSPDKEQRDLFWQTGVDDLNIQMEKYLQASTDEALNMSVGNYVPNPNLYEYALELLDEQGFTVEKDILTPDKNGKPKWIVRQKNGDLVTETAYAYLNRALMDDPRVIQGYQVKSRVDAYNFAKAGVESGEFGSIAQGEEFWARQTIDNISTEAALQLGTKKEEAEKLGDTAARWEEYTNKYDFPEGHSAELIRSDWLQRYRAATQGIEDTRDIINTGINADKDLMNKAFMMYMGVNIQDDLAAAAMSYSMKDYSMTIEADPYGLKLADYEFKSALQKEKFLLDKALKDYELSLQPPQEGDIDLTLNTSNAGNIDISDISDDGTVNSTAPTLQNNNKTKVEYLKNIKAKQAEFILQHHQFTSDDPSNIVINGNKLSINEARKFLNNPNNLKTLEKLYTSAAENIGDPNAFPEGDLSDSEKATLTALRLMPRDIKRDTNRVADLTKLETEVAWNNYKNLLQMKNSYGKELFEAYVDGIPNIFGGDTRGGEGFRGRDATSILSKEEYIAEYNKWADAKGLHRSSVGMIAGGAPVSTPIGSVGASPSIVNPIWAADKVASVYNFFAGEDSQAPRVKKGFDRKASTKKAEELYDEQVKYINATMNGAIDFHQNERGDENFESQFRRFSFIEGVEGIAPGEMTGASGSMMNGYKSQFNPMAPEGTPALTEYMNFKRQIESVGVMSVNFGDQSTMENANMEDDPIARAVLQGLSSSIQTYFTADKDGNGNRKATGLGVRPDFTIEYNPIFGGARDVEKNSGYVLEINNKWMESYLKGQGFTAEAISDWYEDGGSNIISVTVDKRLDQNPKSLQNVFNNNPLSDVAAEINYSSDNNYMYDVHKQSGGFLKVYRDGARYMYEFQGLGFNDETGEFFTQQKGKPQFLTGDPRELDALVSNLEYKMDELSAYNLGRLKLWQEKNPKK